MKSLTFGVLSENKVITSSCPSSAQVIGQRVSLKTNVIDISEATSAFRSQFELSWQEVFSVDVANDAVGFARLFFLEWMLVTKVRLKSLQVVFLCCYC